MAGTLEPSNPSYNCDEDTIQRTTTHSIILHEV